MSKITLPLFNEVKNYLEDDRLTVAQTVKKTGVSATTVRRIEKAIDFWEYKNIARMDAGYPPLYIDRHAVNHQNCRGVHVLIREQQPDHLTFGERLWTIIAVIAVLLAMYFVYLILKGSIYVR